MGKPGVEQKKVERLKAKVEIIEEDDMANLINTFASYS